MKRKRMENGVVNWLAVIAVVVVLFFVLWLLSGPVDFNWGNKGK